MIRVLAATMFLALAASPALACPYDQTSAVQTPTTTAAVQPAAPLMTVPAPCPTCAVPDPNGAAQPQTAPQQRPS